MSMTAAVHAVFLIRACMYVHTTSYDDDVDFGELLHVTSQMMISMMSRDSRFLTNKIRGSTNQRLRECRD